MFNLYRQKTAWNFHHCIATILLTTKRIYQGPFAENITNNTVNAEVELSHRQKECFRAVVLQHLSNRNHFLK